MKELQEKIDSVIDWLTEPNGGNAVDESDIRDAKTELKELKKQLRLYFVSQQRELLKAYFEWEQKQELNIESYQKNYLIEEYLDSL